MDSIENFGKSKLSHGPGSNRIYLMDLHADDFPEIIESINLFAKEKNYTKLFVKVPTHFVPKFLSAGYVSEAFVPNLYNGNGDAHFLVKYCDIKRSIPEHEALTAFQKMLLQPSHKPNVTLEQGYSINCLSESATNSMTNVFKKVFDTYPFPIFDEAFLRKSMCEDGTRYYGVWFNNELVAISSAECNDEKKYAEMTDFAVIPEHRGKKLAIHLLSYMEEQLLHHNFKTFYTIARLHSIPMNKTFYNMGYKYAGTLHNNTQISGKIESMNVWYKTAIKHPAKAHCFR